MFHQHVHEFYGCSEDRLHAVATSRILATTVRNSGASRLNRYELHRYESVNRSDAWSFEERTRNYVQPF